MLRLIRRLVAGDGVAGFDCVDMNLVRRLGRARVPALSGHQIGEVEASRFYFYRNVPGSRTWLGHLLHFENLGAAVTCDDQCLHAPSLTGVFAAVVPELVSPL